MLPFFFFFFIFASRCCCFSLYLLFFPAHDSTCDWKAELEQAVLMCVTLVRGGQGADGMWPGQAKLGHGAHIAPSLFLALPPGPGSATPSLGGGGAGPAQQPGPVLGRRGRSGRKSIGRERGTGEGTGLETLQRTQSRCRSGGISCFSSKKKCCRARGSCSVPSGSSAIAFGFAVSFSAALPTACHPQLFLPPLTQVTVMDGRWGDTPGEFIQSPLNCAECTTSATF